VWTLPAPPQRSEWKVLPFEALYIELLHAISESEDRTEQRLGELALVVFLLGHNYCLSPTDYEAILGSGKGSPTASDWKLAVADFVQEHLQSYCDARPDSLVNRPAEPNQRAPSRLLAWLRDRLPPRWFSLESRGL
jgi:hypothetical protein